MRHRIVSGTVLFTFALVACSPAEDSAAEKGDDGSVSSTASSGAGGMETGGGGVGGSGGTGGGSSSAGGSSGSAGGPPGPAACQGELMFEPAPSGCTPAAMPLNVAEGEVHCLSEDVTVGSGTAISCNGVGATIDLAGHTLTFADSGAGKWLEASGCSDLEIRNGVIAQGAWTGGGGGVEMASIDAGVTIHHVEFQARPICGSGARCKLLDGGSATTTIRDSVFRIGAGDNSFTIANGFEGTFHDNRVYLVGLNGNGGSYPRIFEDNDDAVFHDNCFDVDATSAKVNLWIYWGGGGVTVFNNRIHFASDHGRLFHFDNGASGSDIYNNHIEVTSPGGVIDDGTVAVFRPRGLDNGTQGNVFHHNTVDASQAAIPVYGVSLGDNNPNTGNHVHHNILRGEHPINLYGDGAQQMDIHCNRIEHVGADGYAIEVRETEHDGVRVHHNAFSTTRDDGQLVSYVESGVSGGFDFCGNEGMDDASPPCGVGAPSCWDEAGAP